MIREAELTAGLEPGLRFAVVLDGRCGCNELDWKGVSAWRKDQGFLWVHLERDTPEAKRWIQERSGVDSLAAESLLAEESRPRVEAMEDALVLVLRGVNLCEKDTIELVPIHIWIDGHRAITLRDKDHALSALRDIRLALKAGRGPRNAGVLLVQIAEKIVRDLEPLIDEMDEEVERLEEAVMGTASRDLRQSLADVRRRAIHLRRYLGPQREALSHLHAEDTELLGERDRMRLRAVIDRVVRFLEDLDAIRDRTTVLHQDLAAQISERIATTSNRLTALAALLLPPSLVAGLLGTNIGGIPGQEDPLAFADLLLVTLVLMALQWIFLRRIRWL